MTDEARWMLEGSHGMARDADAAVALLEEKVKDGDAEAMWMLGVCCEFGMGTEQDVERAEQLYQRGLKQEDTTAKLLTDKLKNKNGRGCTQMDLEGEQENNKLKTNDWINTPALVNREPMQCRGSTGVGFDAADACATDNTELER